MKERVEAALKALGLHPDIVDVPTEAGKFLSEMEAGLAGKHSSLMMLPTYLEASGSVTPNEPVTVLDAGGTNLRAASVVFDAAGEPRIEALHRTKMPGTEAPDTAAGMFRAFAEAVLPLLAPGGRIAVCFSYAFRSLAGGEAEILELGKEVDIPDAAGLRVGEGLTAALRAAGRTGPVSVKVVNDTAAVLFSALTAGAQQGAVGFILGTGTNTAYLEDTSAIRTAPDARGQRMMINMESGGYALGPRGVIDRALDAASLLPDYHPHEKAVSGAYLGELMARGARALADEGLLPAAFAEPGSSAGFLMQDVGAFLEDGSGPLAALCGKAGDAETLAALCIAVEQRAGRLAAANLAGVLLRLRKNGFTGEALIAENGTTFAKAAALRESCIAALRAMRADIGPFRFAARADDTLIGTAAASFLG